jgi:hypothetical protein
MRTDAIDCYVCLLGTDGCGPSFKKTGAGVVSTSDSSAGHCTMGILLMFSYYIDFFIYFHFLLTVKSLSERFEGI